MRVISSLVIAVSISAALAGCGGDTSADITPQSVTPVSVDSSKYILPEEPEGAIGVIVARETAEDGQPLVVVGRIGGTKNPWIDGRAAFTLLDASKLIVAEGADSGDNEMCMGDCCAGERAACTMLVKIVDEAGQVLAVDSRQLLGLADNDLVVVQGTAKKDKAGNFVVLGDGVYVRR